MKKNFEIIPNGTKVIILRSKYGTYNGKTATVVSSQRCFKKVGGTLVTDESSIKHICLEHWMSEDGNRLFVKYPEHTIKCTNGTFTENEHTEESVFFGYSYTLSVEGIDYRVGVMGDQIKVK